MSKRNSKESPGSNFYSPAKKKKLNITVESVPKTNNGQSSNKKQEYDPWGDDFLQEEDLLELDAVESQAYSQVVNISQDESFKETPAVQPKPSPKPSNSWPRVPSFVKKSHNPSPKKVTIYPKPSTSNSATLKFLKPDRPSVKESVKSYQEKKLSHVTPVLKNGLSCKPTALSYGIGNTSLSTQSTDFAHFESKLLQENNMNSTFRSQQSIVIVSDDLHKKKLTKLEEENQKLLNDLMTKEGEKVFLRKQQTIMQQKLNEEKLAKSKMIEELETKHRAELLSLRKEKEEAETKYGLQFFEFNKRMANCKILETGSVKLVEPHSVNTNSSNRSRINTTINRGGSAAKKVTLVESAIQAKVFHKSIHKLKNLVSLNPLKGIPECIFEISEPEKPIVDIYMVEKIGKMNLPIFQDEETLRIFENPELVKPIVTIVDNRQLSVQFFLPSLTGLLNKTTEEINSREIMPTINRIVATTRELILNPLTSLRKILNAMKNDDVRDMNDLYHSGSYEIPVSHTENIWDAKSWHEKERGIEARRSLAVVSYVVLTSTYLGGYITGKSRLKVDEDIAYLHYSQRLKTYNSWTNKDCDFEFLEMILEFVTVMGLARRAHHFSGVINAIALTLSNAQKAVGFCSTGLDYVFQIFREIVFSRPLLVCFKSISDMMMTFGGCARFSEKLCIDANSTALFLSNGTWFFKPGPNTCALEIYYIQMQNFARDPITIIDITYAIVSFMQTTLPMNVMSWKEEQGNSCKCCVQLIRFTVKTLCECSRINIDELESKSRKPSTFRDYSKILGSEFWEKLKLKQQDIMIRGIRFLSYLLIREDDYVLRKTKMENAFYLFIDCVKNSKDLKLHENEREILGRLEFQDRVNYRNSSRNSQHLIKCTEKTQVPEAPEKEFSLQSIHKLRRECFSRF